MTMSKLIQIPKIADPLGRNWEQPDESDILVDEECAVMSRKSFDKLKDYSGSQPSALYDGKMWKTCVCVKDGPLWILKFCCNEDIERNVISIVSRPILILE